MNNEFVVSRLQTELLLGAITHCDSTWARNGLETFNDPFARLYWIKEGAGQIRNQNWTMDLQPGRLFVIPSFTPARYQCYEYMELHWVHFRAHLFNAMDVFTSLNWNLDIEAKDSQICEASMATMLAALDSDDVATCLQGDASLRSLIARFAVSPSDNQHSTQMENLQRLLPALSFIEQNLHRQLRLADLAGIVHLQSAYFCALFSQTLGHSPIDYVNRKRVEKAQFLLQQTDMLLKEIAESVGFADVYYFSRVFKNIIGIAPKHYRNQEGGKH